MCRFRRKVFSVRKRVIKTVPINLLNLGLPELAKCYRNSQFLLFEMKSGKCICKLSKQKRFCPHAHTHTENEWKQLEKFQLL